MIRSQPSKDDFNSAALIGIASCLVTALLFLAARRGLPSHFPQVCVSVAALLAFVGLLGMSADISRRFTSVPSFAIPPVASLVFFVGLGLGNWNAYLAGAMLGIGIVCLLYSLRPPFDRSMAVAIATGAVIGFTFFIWTNAFGYPHVWAVETTLTGVVPKDTTFHATLSTMIQKFGRVSTGLSGIVSIIYYPGSHFVIGGMSALSGVLPLWQYSEAQQIFLIPAFVFSVAYAAAMLFRAEPVVAALCSFAVIMAMGMFDWSSFVASESYLLSLIPMFLLLPAMLSLSTFGDMTPIARGVILVAIVVAVASLAFVKMSTAIVVVTVSQFSLLYAVAFGRRWRLFAVYVGIPLLAIFVIVGASIVLDYNIRLFHFVRQYPSQFWGQVAVVVAGAIASLASPVRYWASRRAAALILVATAMICLLPGLIVEIGGGSAYYFQHPVALIACLPVAGWLAGAAGDVACRSPNATLAVQGSVLAVILCVVASGVRPATTSVGQFAAQAELLRSGSFTPIQYYFPAHDEEGFRWLARVRTIFARFGAPATENIENAYLSQVSRRVAAMAPPTERTILYAPPSAATYWRSHLNCLGVPFSLPALTGLPMIFGLPPAATDCPLSAYGYESYGEKDRSHEASPDAVCRAARRAGFSAVLTIAEPPSYVVGPQLCGEEGG